MTTKNTNQLSIQITSTNNSDVNTLRQFLQTKNQ